MAAVGTKRVVHVCVRELLALRLAASLGADPARGAGAERRSQDGGGGGGGGHLFQVRTGLSRGCGRERDLS